MKQGVDCKGNIWEERAVGKQMVDLTGYKFTKLTVLFPVYIEGRSKTRNYWLCKCDCGKEIACRSDCLHGKKIQSCGCMTIEGVYKKSRAIIDETIGQRFGKLVVEEFAGYQMKSDGVRQAMFRCKCDCGNDNFVVAGNSLRGGWTLSCGCITRSIGEENIEKILKDNKIYFKSEYTFSDLRSDKNRPLPYDFAIFNKDANPIRLIEFDGDQHVRPVECFGGKEGFQRRQENDILKNQYALSHNIPLIRIPYSLRDIVTLEDLMGNKYLITIQN